MDSPPEPRKRPLLDFTILIVVAVAISGVLLFGLNQGKQRRGGIGGLELGSIAPSIEVQGWRNGKPPQNLAGEVVVVDVWATWCDPCFDRAPELVSLYQKYHDRGVVFIGLTDEDASELPNIERFLEQTGITWPNGYGAAQTLVDFKLVVRPSLWVIDRNGKIVWNIDSPGDPDVAIEAALASGSGAG